MTRFAGPALMITGVGHALLGVVLFWRPVVAIVGDGVVNSIGGGQFDREAAFWFMLFGPACFLLGQLVKHAIARGDSRLLSLVGWNLVAIGAAGALVMPVSGFWILIAIAPFVFNAARIEAASEFAAGAAQGGV